MCVYNGKARVGDVLEALTAQRAGEDAFRVIVVDNNSTDGTAEFVASHPAFARLAQQRNTPTIIHEPRQGLMFARLAGVLAARTDVLCFLDDDNVPDPDYVAKGAAFFADRPNAGVAVSSIRPQWEVPPRPAVLRREAIFGNFVYMGGNLVEFKPTDLAPTVGSGLWLRRSAVLAAVPWQHPERMMPDRIGNRMVSGNDIEIGILMKRAGYDRFYVPDLRITHKIPRGRLRTKYLTKLIIGITRSQATLDEVYGAPRTLVGRMASAGEFVGALFAAPTVALVRRDGLREAWFGVVRRYALAVGPYPELTARMRSAS
jgi:glycosyltransferase involved in cell wall biosynthesis